MPQKLMRCVEHVKEQNARKPGAKKVNPYAVCSASTGMKFEHKKRPNALLDKD